MGVRNWLRTTFLDHELGVIGGQIELMESRQEQLAIQAAALTERFERLANRTQMRLARSAKKGNDPSAEDLRILDEIRASRGMSDNDQNWG